MTQAHSRLGAPGRLARRILLRAIRPYTVFQQTVDVELARLVETLGARTLDDEAVGVERHAATLAALRDHARHLPPKELIDGHTRSIAGLQSAVGELHGTDRELEKAFKRVDGALKHMEWDTQAVPYTNGSPFVTVHHPVAGVVQGYSDSGGSSAHPYRSFEDTFRGSEEFIRERQRPYLEVLKGREPVLEFGCGRGEFLDLLADAGLASLGVDLDAGMVARCHEKGHTQVVHADGLEYLESLDDRSLGAIFSAQVIEHLPYERLLKLLALARAKLRDDGLFIAETVNPHSVPALKTFWVDLTHQHPIFPEVALALCRDAGFASAYVFHPGGTGDIERDRFSKGSYAVVANSTELLDDLDP